MQALARVKIGWLDAYNIRTSILNRFTELGTSQTVCSGITGAGSGSVSDGVVKQSLCEHYLVAGVALQI